jgi:hypothetical protein
MSYSNTMIASEFHDGKGRFFVKKNMKLRIQIQDFMLGVSLVAAPRAPRHFGPGYTLWRLRRPASIPHALKEILSGFLHRSEAYDVESS